MEMNEKDIILKVDGLKVYFYTASGVNKAVDGVSFYIEERLHHGYCGRVRFRQKRYQLFR